MEAGAFFCATGGNAQDSNSHITFDPITGNVFHDTDGSGAAAKVLMATLAGINGTLNMPDFVARASPL